MEGRAFKDLFVALAWSEYCGMALLQALSLCSWAFAAFFVLSSARGASSAMGLGS